MRVKTAVLHCICTLLLYRTAVHQLVERSPEPGWTMPVWRDMPHQVGPEMRAQYAAVSEYSLSLHDDYSGSAGEFDEPEISYADWFLGDDDDIPDRSRWVCMECGKSVVWNVIAEN